MWHRVSLVAESRRIPEKELVEFAEKNEAKYGIDHAASGDPMVSTWYVDDLVRDFRKQSK